MTDTEILDFCEENDVEVSFNFEKLTEGYRIRIRRGYFQYCTFVTRDQIESSKAWGSAIKITLTNMLDALNRAEHEQEERHAQDHADRRE